MNGLLDRIVQRRRASASTRLGPPNGTAPADRTTDATANGSGPSAAVPEAPPAPEPAPVADPPPVPDQPPDPERPSLDEPPPDPEPPRAQEPPPAPEPPAPERPSLHEPPPDREPRSTPRRTPPSPPVERATGAQPPGLRERSRIRRRTRFLRRLRQLQLRDIGGFMVELHRFGRDRPDLVKVKVEAAAKTDRELRALEHALGEGRPMTDVREPGIGGACPACGTVHGSADRYCSWCGREL